MWLQPLPLEAAAQLPSDREGALPPLGEAQPVGGDGPVAGRRQQAVQAVRGLRLSAFIDRRGGDGRLGRAGSWNTCARVTDPEPSLGARRPVGAISTRLRLHQELPAGTRPRCLGWPRRERHPRAGARRDAKGRPWCGVCGHDEVQAGTSCRPSPGSRSRAGRPW